MAAAEGAAEVGVVAGVGAGGAVVDPGAEEAGAAGAEVVAAEEAGAGAAGWECRGFACWCSGKNYRRPTCG